MRLVSNRILWIGLVLFSLAAAGCSDPPPPAGEPVTPTAGATTAAAASLHFSAPEGWIEQPPSSAMRRAEYRLPSDQQGVEDAELAVFVFPGSGGSVQANIDRWIGQFTGPDGDPVQDQAKVERTPINGLLVTTVDVSGRYDPGMAGPRAGAPASPRPGYRLLGAIVESQGDPWFFKLTGPEQTVDRWEQSFHGFLQSIHMEE